MGAWGLSDAATWGLGGAATRLRGDTGMLLRFCRELLEVVQFHQQVDLVAGDLQRGADAGRRLALAQHQ